MGEPQQLSVVETCVTSNVGGTVRWLERGREMQPRPKDWMLRGSESLRQPTRIGVHVSTAAVITIRGASARMRCTSLPQEVSCGRPGPRFPGPHKFTASQREAVFLLPSPSRASLAHAAT
jgi:hypothetical protein